MNPKLWATLLFVGLPKIEYNGFLGAEMEVVYKVIRGPLESGAYYSAVATGRLSLRYWPRQWAESEYGAVLAFARLEDAIKFAMSDLMVYQRNACLWRAETPEFAFVRTLLAQPFDSSVVKMAWRGLSFVRPDFLRRSDLIPTPAGTIACPKIKLIERAY